MSNSSINDIGIISNCWVVGKNIKLNAPQYIKPKEVLEGFQCSVIKLKIY